MTGPQVNAFVEAGEPGPLNFETQGEYMRAWMAWNLGRQPKETLIQHWERVAKESPAECCEIGSKLLLRALVTAELEERMGQVWSAVYAGHREQALHVLERMHTLYRGVAEDAGATCRETLPQVAQDQAVLHQHRQKLFLECALPLPPGLPN